MTPIERAARAIASDYGQDPDSKVPINIDGGIASLPVWKTYIPAVRAVLAAIREPSDVMQGAAFKSEVEFRTVMGNLDRGFCEGDGVWQSMIDALLEEG